MSMRGLVVALVVLLCTIHGTRSRTVLDPVGIYGSTKNAKACLVLAFSKILEVMDSYEETAPDVAANCLRFAFHDAGTYLTATDEGGANGSLMLEPESASLMGAVCPGAIEAALQEARGTKACRNLTYADAIQVAGSVAVSRATHGSVTCKLLMGRPDSGVPDDPNSLPHPCQNATALTATFKAMGFEDPETAVVVLSGAHNLGSNRATGQAVCGNTSGFSVGTLNARSDPLGQLTISNTKFDSHYFKEVVYKRGQKGFLQSDRALVNKSAGATPLQRALMATYAGRSTAFYKRWCGFYREMSLLGVDAKPSGLNATSGWLPIKQGSLNVSYS